MEQNPPVDFREDLRDRKKREEGEESQAVLETLLARHLQVRLAVPLAVVARGFAGPGRKPLELK